MVTYDRSFERAGNDFVGVHERFVHGVSGRVSNKSYRFRGKRESLEGWAEIRLFARRKYQEE